MKPPVERVNFFNGQRLEAADLRAEQDYHIAVRRELNRRLYSPGIASGLEVEVAGDSHLCVLPGLALDFEGKEIILAEPAVIPACGAARTQRGVVYGNFVVIRYAEDKTAPVTDGCVTTGKKSGKELAWGAPTRIRSEPIIQIQDAWPSEASGKIVLAQIELDEKCHVVDVRRGVRKYVNTVKSPIVKPVSLGGEKDIDAKNAKTIYFHIEGGFPESVRLYLRAAQFSTLFYTELGKHSHEVEAQTSSVGHDFGHSHDAGDATTDPGGKHNHGIQMDDGEDAPGADTDSPDGVNTHIITYAPDHVHTIKGFKLTPALGPWDHSHTVSTSAQPSGASDQDADTGQPTKKFIDGLQVWYDGKTNLTQPILGLLQAREGAAGSTVWDKLGDGQATHRLVTQGTGPIELTTLGVDLVPGEHFITLSVAAGGGQVHYNLYVG